MTFIKKSMIASTIALAVVLGGVEIMPAQAATVLTQGKEMGQKVDYFFTFHSNKGFELTRKNDGTDAFTIYLIEPGQITAVPRNADRNAVLGLTLEEFLSDWSKGGNDSFSKVSPTAAVTFLDKDGAQKTLPFVAKVAKLEKDGKSLKIEAEPAQVEGKDKTGIHIPDADMKHEGHAVMFVDGVWSDW